MNTLYEQLPVSLPEVPCGMLCKVLSIGSARLSLLLSEFGVLNGSLIRVLSFAPWKGPIAIQAEDLQFCIRREDADLIQVSLSV